MARRLPSTDDREHHDSRSPVVRFCADLADSSAFNLVIFAVIFANAVVLGLETYDGIVRDYGGLLRRSTTSSSPCSSSSCASA